MMEIFLEGKRLDVYQGDKTLLTFAVDDIKDFSSRNTSFSKTIILPGTANNNRLFGGAFDARVSNFYNPGSNNVASNFNPSVSAKCQVFQSRMQVFKGTMRLLEIVIADGTVEYEVAVFGELGGLISAIGNATFDDLDFTAYNHVFNASGITDSWDSLNGSGYTYPLIDIGGVSTDKIDYDIRAFRPSLFVREYIDKIITNAGYSWSSNLMNTSRFKSLIVPYNQKTLRSLEDSFVNADRDSTVYVVTNAITQANVSFENFTGNSWTANVDKSEFTYTGADTAEFRIRFRVAGVSVLTWAPVFMRLRKNNTDVIPNTVQVLDVINTAANYVWEKEVVVTMAQNDYMALWVYWGTVGVSNQNDVTVQNATLTIESLNPVYTDLTVGDTVDFNISKPTGILQRDFLSSVIKLFNLYVYESSLYDKKIYIEPYTDFYDLNPSGVVDWTYKVDRSREIRLKPMSELNSRYYRFKFKDDADYYNELYKKKYSETYGEYLYDSQYEFANEKTEIELIFSPTVLVGYAGLDKVVPTIFKKNAGVEEKIDFNIRILQAKKITGVTSWDIKDGTSVLSTETDYLYAGHYDDPDAPANDLHFGVPAELYFTLVSGAINVTQFNVYWSPYMAEITDKDSKLMTCWMKLDNSDIFSLDFSKLVYVDGSYWRLNKIEDWDASDPGVCRVELLKVINLLY